MGKVAVLRQTWSFLKQRKKWWLFPVLIMLVLLGSLIAASSGSVVAPFIYALF